MDTLIHDLQSGFRWLRKSPGFTVIAVLCLAVGIGVNTTIFSCVYGGLYRPLDFIRPERLVVMDRLHHTGGAEDLLGMSEPVFRDFERSARSFVTIGAISGRSVAISDGGEPERYQGMLVTSNLFPMLGVRPLIGRGFHADEDRPGAPGTVLLSHRVWESRYHRDPSIVGRTILVSGAPCTVIGVMPERFRFPFDHDVWLPLGPATRNWARTFAAIQVMARLRDSVTLKGARAEVEAIARRLADHHSDELRGWTFHLRTFPEMFRPSEVRLVLLTMLGAVTFVLLIACANVANLLLARAAARQREMAIRTAIGAGRGRILRQLLTESVLLAGLGGALGVLLAFWGIELMAKAIPAGAIPYTVRFTVDGPALLYTLLISVLTGILFGLAPAFEASRVNLHDSLKDGARSSGGQRRTRFRNALVIGQVALAMVLLVGAALFVRTVLQLQRESAGFETGRLMTLRFYLPGERYATDGARTRRVEDVMRRIESLPGVEAAAASNTVALGNGGNIDGVIVEGRDVPRGEEPQVFFTGVTAHWFRTLGVPLQRGRDFTESEAGESSGVAIVNETLVRRLWPRQDPLGRRLRFVSNTTGQWLSVIGVSRDFGVTDLDPDQPVSAVFLPYPYFSTANTGVTIRVQGEPAAITPLVRREIRAADPIVPLFEVQTMDEVRRLSYWDRALFGKIFGAFGLIALLLASIGVYGVISYGVSQRTHEIGVRMALGARGADVLRLIVGQGLRLALTGILLGLAGALLVTRVIQSQLWKVSPTDPVSFAGIVGLLVAVASVASWHPAWRATRVEPMAALREE